MGEAKRRGNKDQRIVQAVRREGMFKKRKPSKARPRLVFATPLLLKLFSTFRDKD